MALLSITLNKLKTDGIRPTLWKAIKILTAEGDDGAVQSLAGWHKRQGVDQPVAGGELFLKAHVLIIGAFDLPQCMKYRVMQKVEFLQKREIRVTIAAWQDELRCLNYLQTATMLIVYRVPEGRHYDRYLTEARRLGCFVMYDIDDPIFSRDIYRNNGNLDYIDRVEREGLLRQVEAYSRAMGKTDAVIVSTPILRQAAEAASCLPVYLWPNVIDGSTLAIKREITSSSADLNNRKNEVLLGYMSGSRAHEADFRVMIPALCSLFERHDNLIFVIFGYAGMPEQLQPFESRVRRFPFSSYRAYLETLSTIDINLIPLVDNDFNRCKSTIRYLESSLFEIPSVASGVGYFSDTISTGVNGLLANGIDDWVSAIEGLVENPDLCRRIGKAAYMNVMRNWTIDQLAVQLDPDLLRRLES